MSGPVKSVEHAEDLATLHHIQRKVRLAVERAREAVSGPNVVAEDHVNALHNLLDDLEDVKPGADLI